MNTNTKKERPPVFPVFALGSTGMIDIETAFTNEPKELDFVFSGLLAGTVGAIVAAGSTGKSYLALGILADLATGRDILGLDIQESDKSTVYLTLEDPADILANRIHYLGGLYGGADRLKIQQRMIVESQMGRLLHLVDQDGYYSQAIIDCMVNAFTGKRLVILDTLRRFHAGNENDSGHMSTLISCFEQIAQRTGAAVLFLHHVNKSASFNGADAQGASRGSAALTDNIRCQINLVTMSEDDAKDIGVPLDERKKFVQYVDSKINYKEDLGAKWLARKSGGVLVEADFSYLSKQSMSEKYCGGRR
jgi:hypothetical protein